MLGTFSMSGSVVGGIGGVGICGSGGTGRGGGNFGGGRGDGGHPHLSSAAVPGPCIRYLPSLQIQFICSVCTASNLNIVVLDCRLGPTLSCLVAEKS